MPGVVQQAKGRVRRLYCQISTWLGGQIACPIYFSGSFSNETLQPGEQK